MDSTSKFKGYWDSYYTNKLAPSHASGFAQFALTYMEPGRTLIDLGCGNGRDSIFFAQNGINVTAVDMSESGVEDVRRGSGDLPLTAVQDDFVKSKVLFGTGYDYCYSRWTIHAIDDSQQSELLENVWAALKDGGLFFIETRTTGDDIFGIGEKAGPLAYIHENHYRRFIEPDDLARQLKDQGYELLYFEESRGFSKTEDSDPVLLRVVAKKQK